MPPKRKKCRIRRKRKSMKTGKIISSLRRSSERVMKTIDKMQKLLNPTIKIKRKKMNLGSRTKNRTRKRRKKKRRRKKKSLTPQSSYNSSRTNSSSSRTNSSSYNSEGLRTRPKIVSELYRDMRRLAGPPV